MNADPKPGLVVLVALLLTSSPPCDAAIEGRLHQPGKVRHGDLIKLTDSGDLLFNSASDPQPQLISRAKLTAFIFTSPPKTNSLARPENSIRLRDGSSISGQLLSLDDSTLSMATAYSQPLVIARSEVAFIRWNRFASDVFYEGQYTTNQWIISPVENPLDPSSSPEPSWKLMDGIFVSQGRGTLACDVGMPTLARVEFDLHWQNKSRFRLAFYTPDTEHYNYSEGYRFYSPGHGILFAMTPTHNPKLTINQTKATIPALSGSNSVHLDFRLNSVASEGWLFADGKEVRHWTDLGYCGVGTAVMIYNLRATNRLGVSNLRISRWDGRSVDDPKPIDHGHKIVFKNGDTVTTTKLTISGSKLTLRFHDTPLTIPANRTGQIFMPPRNTPAATGSTWLQFQQGDWVRASIIAIRADSIQWRPDATRAVLNTPHSQIRGIYFATGKPVMDLSWYLPTMAAPEGKP